MASSKKIRQFNMGIKQLKRTLRNTGMPKSDINKTVKLYKQRLYKRVGEVKSKMEDKLLPKDKENAKDK